MAYTFNLLSHSLEQVKAISEEEKAEIKADFDGTDLEEVMVFEEWLLKSALEFTDTFIREREVSEFKSQGSGSLGLHSVVLLAKGLRGHSSSSDGFIVILHPVDGEEIFKVEANVTPLTIVSDPK